MYLRNLFLASAIATASLGSAGVIADDAMARQLSEARKEGQIVGAYSLNRHLSRYKLDADVDGDRVVLSGVVSSDVAKELASDIAQGLDGIATVDNRIEVSRDGAQQTITERDFGDAVADATITATVKSKLQWHRATEGLAIDVETRDGTVVLAGNIVNIADRALVVRLVQSTDGVRSVVDRLGQDANSNSSVQLSGNEGQTGHGVPHEEMVGALRPSVVRAGGIPGARLAPPAAREGVVVL